MNAARQILRFGTRGSLLARTQSRLVADALERAHPGLQVDLVTVTTSGDRITDQPLHAFGGKGLFTKELEQALLAGAVDFAVHSYKDVPVTMPLVDASDLMIAATPKREDARDVLAVRAGPAPMSLGGLPAGARVGTGSLRRRCQLLAARPDLVVEPIRGNIDTRLRKLAGGEYDAVVLAMAGVRRAGLFDEALMAPIDPAEMLPAAGQGALALQCRRADGRSRELLAALHDPETEACVDAERSLVAKLGGDCHSPIAALAEFNGENLVFRAAVGARDGGLPVRLARAVSGRANPSAAVDSTARSLYDQGIETLLRGG